MQRSANMEENMFIQWTMTSIISKQTGQMFGLVGEFKKTPKIMALVLPSLFILFGSRENLYINGPFQFSIQL